MISLFQWETPKKLIENNKTGDNWLPPPQFYELSRLRNEPDIDKVVSFAKHRALNSPTTLIFPLHFPVKDGIIHCYPGDDFYPKSPNYSVTEHNMAQYEDKTCEECRKMAMNLHRAEAKTIQNIEIWQNIKLPDNHLSPQTIPASKL